MAAQLGRNFILQMGDGTTTEGFTTVGGFRSNSFTVNNSPVDITTKTNAPVQTLLEGAGLRSVSISGDGVFEDSAFEETLRAAAFSDDQRNYQVILPNLDTLAGAFNITSYNRSGGHLDAETFSISLESSGTITYTAA